MREYSIPAVKKTTTDSQSETTVTVNILTIKRTYNENGKTVVKTEMIYESLFTSQKEGTDRRKEKYLEMF